MPLHLECSSFPPPFSSPSVSLVVVGCLDSYKIPFQALRRASRSGWMMTGSVRKDKGE